MKQILWIGICCFVLLSFQSSSIRARTGEVFKVVLESNRSTGYSWHWENKDTQSHVDSVYVDYVLKDKTMIGGGGNEIWEFRAKQKGKQELIMVYKRPWESDPVAERKVFVIQID